MKTDSSENDQKSKNDPGETPSASEKQQGLNLKEMVFPITLLAFISSAPLVLALFSKTWQGALFLVGLSLVLFLANALIFLWLRRWVKSLLDEQQQNTPPT